MIYTDSQLKEKIVRMIESFENEVVEFKEARTNYSFNDIGKYFSALSNEANLRGLQEAWLIFGISDDKRYVGTEFRKQGSLQSLKKEIVNGTNERLTFLEIYELTMEKCRDFLCFQVHLKCKLINRGKHEPAFGFPVPSRSKTSKRPALLHGKIKK